MLHLPPILFQSESESEIERQTDKQTSGDNTLVSSNLLKPKQMQETNQASVSQSDLDKQIQDSTNQRNQVDSVTLNEIQLWPTRKTSDRLHFGAGEFVQNRFSTEIAFKRGGRKQANTSFSRALCYGFLKSIGALSLSITADQRCDYAFKDRSTLTLVCGGHGQPRNTPCKSLT